MTDYESTEHLTEKETGDNGCLNKLRNILKKKLERDVEITPIDGLGQEKKRIRKRENDLFTYLEDQNRLNIEKDNTDNMLKKIDELIEQGANINYHDENGKGNNVLHEVCMLNEIDSLKVFKKLREKSAEIKENLYGQTVLHLASYFNKIELVKYIIENDNSNELINKATYDEKQTALHYAAKQGNTAIVKHLLENGANIEAVDFIDRTPIYLACEHGRIETAEFLIKKEARVEVTNKFGQKCLYWLISKCPDLAPDVLDKYREFNIYTKKDIYHLKCVELDPKYVNTKTHKDSQIKSILTLIVDTSNLDLIVHPVIVRLIKVKWEEFTRYRSFIDLLLTFVNIIIWNLIGALYGPFDQRYFYKFPQDGWKVFLFVAGSFGVIVLVTIELYELFKLSKYNKRVSNQRIKEMQDYGSYSHCQPGQQKFCQDEKKAVSNNKLLKPYLKDFWNWFDIISICLLFVCVVTHIVDVLDHSEYIARIHIRILSISIIWISIRLLKVGRYLNQVFGQLVMTIYFVVFDIITWLIIYVTFWIPFSSAFWMLFGGEQSSFTSSDNTTVVIDGLDSYNNTVFHLFRVTFGADLDRNNMLTSDNVLTDPLIGIYLGLTSLIAVNVFIAQLTATFNRIHDRSKAYFMLQRAKEVLSIEHSMKIENYKKHLEKLQKREEDKKPRKKNLDHNMNDQTKDLINETIKTIKEQAEKLDEKLNELTNQFDQNVLTRSMEPNQKFQTAQKDLKALKDVVFDFIINKKSPPKKPRPEKEAKYLTQSVPRVDVLRSNEINENQVNLERILSPLEDDSSF